MVGMVMIHKLRSRQANKWRRRDKTSCDGCTCCWLVGACYRLAMVVLTDWDVRYLERSEDLLLVAEKKNVNS